MSTRQRELFTTIRTEGGLLPSALLERIADGDDGLEGLRAEDYHLAKGERLGEAINRAWARLVGAWSGFRDALASLGDDDPAVGLTRERWLLILFQELGYGRLQTAHAVEIDDKSYPVSHAWGSVPIHLVGAGVRLDRKAKGVAGAARMSPHPMVQELLNRSDERLWAFLSNGLRLRILRNNVALTRQAYVEFDLEAMMDGEVYSDFVVLWLVCHQSRVEADPIEECWLERWSEEARTQGTRALEHLRDGVEAAITSLGDGFLAHPANTELRSALQSGEVSPQDFYRQLLRVVYRLLFLLVAEERNLLLDPDADDETRRRYRDYYSMARIRGLAERPRRTAHTDLWAQIQVVVDGLGSEEGLPALGLPALGSFLFSEAATPALNGCEISNSDLLAGFWALSGRSDQRRRYRWRFDYRNLGVEELGSVYESLLELHPELNVPAGRFELTLGGAERRATGSHYTPPPILKRVLDFALDPAIEAALAAPDPEHALLNLRVLDPACGSGHFLIGAAHRIAHALATVRTGESEASPDDLRPALRDVVARCLYGVDLNPMAVELCRVALWLETLEPGKPLSFLDHHIRAGNSLLGVPLGNTVVRNRETINRQRGELEDEVAQLEERANRGDLTKTQRDDVEKRLKKLRKELRECVYDSWTDAVPDDAFKATADDDRDVARRAQRDNRRERRSGQLRLAKVAIDMLPEDLVKRFDALGAGAEDTVVEVTIRAEEFEDVRRQLEYQHALDLADTWTAAFFWPLVEHAPAPPTQATFLTLQEGPGSMAVDESEKVNELTAQYAFFHFELAFPEVFTADRGGFDVVIGNPPYMMGMKISGTLGPRVYKFLRVTHDTHTGGRVDLAAYFLRRGFDLLRPNGDLGLITTNSIADGDTLDAGLRTIVGQWGGVLGDAWRSLPWGGSASVDVTALHLHRGDYDRIPTLDGEPVDEIAPTLSRSGGGEPEPINDTRAVVGKGANPVGDFELTAQERDALLREEPRSVEIVKPLYGADEATSLVDPEIRRRWIIDFEGRSLDEARAYPVALERVRQRVKPKRDRSRRESYKKRWWQFAERSARLHDAVGGLADVIVMPETSKHMVPVLLPGGAVYRQTLFVFMRNDFGLFGLLSSQVHWLWAARPGGCSSQRTFPRYHQGRCFGTLPLPAALSQVAAVGQELHQVRLSIMQQRNEGITDVYNRVIDPDDTNDDVTTLRNLHTRLDEAVAQAYGWDDLIPEFSHGHHPTARFGVRWTVQPATQRKIEARLLELNLGRAGRLASD